MALNKVTYVDGETIIGAANLNAIQDEIISQEANKVPTSRKINNNALTSDVTLTAANVGAVPTTRTVNGKALSANIALTAADVGAASASALTDKADYIDLTIAQSEASSIEEAVELAYNRTTVTGRPVVIRFVWGGQWTGIVYKYSNASYGSIFFSGPANQYTYFGYMVNGTFTLFKNAFESNVSSTQRIFAPVIQSMVAPKNLYVGDTVIYSDAMYRAVTNISSGDTLTPNSNVVRVLETGYRKVIVQNPSGYVQVTERQYATLATLNLTAGTWLLIGTHEFDSASEYPYQDVFFQSTTTLGITRNIPGGSGGGATTTCIFTTTTTGYTVVTYQTYGTGTAGSQIRQARRISVVAIRLY